MWDIVGRENIFFLVSLEVEVMTHIKAKDSFQINQNYYFVFLSYLEPKYLSHHVPVVNSNGLANEIMVRILVMSWIPA